MKAACQDLISKLLGRPASGKLTQGLDDAMALHMRLLARKDPQAWGKMTQYERMSKAASAAAEEMRQDVIKKQQRVALTIAAADRVNTFLESRGLVKPGDKLRAVSQLLDFDTKGAGFTSVGSRTKALQMETFGNLLDVWESSHPKFFGLFEDKAGTTALIRELWGEDSGNPAAKAGAKSWRTIMDDMRTRANAAGMDIGKLDEWHYPQTHSQQRIASAGFEKWFADTVPLLDRSKYADAADGHLLNDGELKPILAKMYDSITTDGAAKRQSTRPVAYGQQGNRDSQHRTIFYKDSDSFLKYQGDYGDKSLWSVLTGHVRTIARDVAMAETLGPDPDTLFGAFNQRALTEELRANPTRFAKLQKAATFNDKLFDYVSGRQSVVDPELAARFQGFRNFMTATKLPKVIITAMGDYAGMASTAFANKVPFSDTFMRHLRTLNPVNDTDHRIMQRNGVGLDGMMSGLNRFGQEDYSAGWTGKLASWVMHASGAERMWDARREGMASVLMSYIADTVPKVEHFADLNPIDHGVLAQKGISENDWQTWKLATPELWNGKTPMLTPKAIHAIPDEVLVHLGDPDTLRRSAATNLLAHVLEEAGMGAMDTGPRQRVTMQLGTTKGTWGGELLHSAMLFKSFAASMMMKHWARAAQQPGMGSKFGYIAPLIIYGTVIAALGNQVRNLLLGRDPQNMASPAFWGAAVLRGGGLGFFGDFFYDEFTEQDTSLAAALGGPLMTTGEDIWKLSGAALIHHLQGQRTDEAGNLIRFAKQNTPGLNLWYTQAAMDHILWNSMQEAASPGYLDRMEERAQAMKGTSYYWRPEDTLPSRAPDVSASHLFDTERGGQETSKIEQTVGIE
jgi:hypothetical protein